VASERVWRVDGERAGLRLDKFLSAADRLVSRARAADAIARGKVFINDVEASRTDAARRLSAGDVIRLWVDRPGSAHHRGPWRVGPLDILYEDSALAVINKPPGLLTVPLARRQEAASVEALLEAYLRKRGHPGVRVVHRIDRDTSGLVVFAKHARAQLALKHQFRRHAPERVYWAIVYGHVTPQAGTWRDHLVWDPDALIQKETHPKDPRAAEAVSDYRVLETFHDTSLIEVHLHTGKRNQIRLQARLHGHMLVGETRYVYGPDHLRPIPFNRQALHARRLRFMHPETGLALEFEARLPPDMAELLTVLRTTVPRAIDQAVSRPRSSRGDGRPRRSTRHQE
jgi:23S rRNA pseudouridine1911/1915/1917 synthase